MRAAQAKPIVKAEKTQQVVAITEPPKTGLISIRQLAIAIGKAEGYTDKTSQAYKRNNPGNIMCYTAKRERYICRYKSVEAGYKALEKSILAHASYDRTLLQMIKVYSPSSDGNNPYRHASNIAAFANIPLDQPLKEIIINK